MQALSIQQPWAWLIVNGYKQVENRDWWTKFRGRVLIHAGKKVDPAFDYEWAEDLLGGIHIPREVFCGGIVGAATITDCVTRMPGNPWFFGKHGFVMENAVALDVPVPCKGQLGFFKVPDDVAVILRNMTIKESPIHE
jgi:hypothetical protein